MPLKPSMTRVIVALCILIRLIQAQELSPKLSGRVTESGSGSPIAGATITLVPPYVFGQLHLQTARTDSNGNYRFTEVVDGSYSITASAGDFVSQDYNRDTTPEGAFVRVDSSTRVHGLDFCLAHEAVISGVVVDEAEKPVASVPVTAVKQKENDKEPGRVVAAARTDVLGRFVLGGLPAATYLVCANGPAGYGASSIPGPPFRETWYGDSISSERAIPITLKEGDERQDLRISVASELRHQVIVWPSGPDGVVTPDRYEVLIEHRNQISMKQPDGSYVIPDIPPGHYTLVSTAWSQTQYLGQGEEGFDLSDSDVTVHVHLGGLGEIAGVVEWEGAPVAPSEKALFAIESEEGAVQGVRADAKRHFDISGVLPGNYTFKAFKVGPVAVPRSVQCGGREISDESPLEVGDREKILDCRVTLVNP